MYSAKINYSEPYKIIFDPSRQGFKYIPNNAVLAEILNINTMQNLFFEPTSVKNIENNRILSDFLTNNNGFPNVISGFNPNTEKTLDQLWNEQQQRVNQDRQTAFDTWSLKQRLNQSYNSYDQSAFNNYLPNTIPRIMDRTWFSNQNEFIPQNKTQQFSIEELQQLKDIFTNEQQNEQLLLENNNLNDKYRTLTPNSNKRNSIIIDKPEINSNPGFLGSIKNMFTSSKKSKINNTENIDILESPPKKTFKF